MGKFSEKEKAEIKQEALRELKEAQERVLQSIWLGENYKNHMDLAIELLAIKAIRERQVDHSCIIYEEDVEEEKQKIKDDMEHEIALMEELLEDLFEEGG